MKIKFNNSIESVRWVAQQNENHFCYEAAARLYREIGDEESAKRCESLAKAQTHPNPK